ncbi:MAG: CocE/NonD family hydrolase [Acidobacteriota bacterium]
MRSRHIARLTTQVFAILFIAAPVHAATPFARAAGELDFVRRLRDATPPAARPALTNLVEMVRMDDGVRLHTSVYLASQSGRYPAILVRTPYNDATDGLDDYGYSGIADYYCPRGYAVVIQTIRGKYASEGTYRLMSRGEIDDGYAAIEWISRQAWCDGNVAVMGVSHDGFDALAAGIRNPSGLKLVISGGGPADLRTDAFMQKGTLGTSLLDYIDFMFTETGQPYDDLFFRLMETLGLPEPRLLAYDTLVSGKELPAWDEHIKAMSRVNSDYWQKRRIRDRLHECKLPIVQFAGLYSDGDMPDVLRNFEYLEERGIQGRLILGWWAHGSSGPYGDVEGYTPPDVLKRYNALLDYYLKGLSSPILNEKRIQVFAAGEGKFVPSNTWPQLPGYTSREFYFARGSTQAGKLLSAPRSESKPNVSYAYDPKVLPTILYDPGPIRNHTDQLAFLSDPMPADTPVCGKASLTLYVSSTARDTDFYAAAFVRQTDGTDRELGPGPGLLQARQRDGDYARPKMLVPGQVYAVTIEPPFISGIVKKGERLGVVVFSNAFPVVIRNANSGKPIGSDKAFITATQKFYLGKLYPSKLTLSCRSPSTGG